jgi:hypothetical protein
MKRRVQVGNLPEAPSIQAQARPVDTWYLPQEAGVTPPARSNNLLQLAEALRQIQPGIDKFVATKSDQIQEAELKRGAESALKNKLGFNEAIKQGLIPPGASPWFRIGFQQERLRTLGQAYDIQIREKWATSEVRNSDKQEDFQQFLQEERSALFNSLGDEFDNRDIQDVLIPLLQKSEAHLTNEHTNYRLKQMEIQAAETMATEVGNTLDEYYKPGLLEKDRTAMLARLGTVLTGLGSRSVGHGMVGTKVNEILVDTLATYALDHEDIHVRELLDHIQTGSGVLGKTGYAREKWAKVEEHILDVQEKRERFAWAKDDRAKQEKIDTLQSRIMMKLIQDPTADIVTDVKTLAVLDPEKARAVFSFQEARLDAQYKVRDNHYLLSALQAGIYTNQTTPHDILMAVANRELSGDAGARLLEDLNRFQQDSQTRSVLDNDYLRILRDNLRSAIQKGDGFGGFDNDSILRANQADIRFVKAAQQYLQKNPNADEETLFEYLRGVYQNIINDPIYTDSGKPVPGSEPVSKPKPTQAAPQSTPKPVAKNPAPAKSEATFTQPKFYTTTAGFNAAMQSGEIQKQMNDLGVPPQNRSFFIEKMRRYAEIQEQLQKIRQLKGGSP